MPSKLQSGQCLQTLNYGFFKNEPLIRQLNIFWTFISSKLDSPVISFFFTLSECLSNVLIIGESNLDGKKWATDQTAILKEITIKKIHTLASSSLKSSQTSLWTILVETGSIQSVPCLLPY